MQKFNMNNIEPMLKQWQQLPQKLQRKALRPSARRGMNVVRNAVRAAARASDNPSTSNNIVKNIVTQSMNNRQLRRAGSNARFDVGMRVGVMGGSRRYANTSKNRRLGRAGGSYNTAGSKSNPGGDTWYWRFVDQGTKRTRPRNFMRGAMGKVTPQVIEQLGRGIGMQLDKLETLLR